MAFARATVGAGALLCAAHGMAAQAVYLIDECAQPLALELHGVPSVAGIPLETTLDVCREQSAFEMQLKDVADAAEWRERDARAPQVAWVRRDGKLDVRVELHDEAAVRVYEGKQIAPGAKEAVLRRVDHSGGPDLSVSLRLVEGPAVIAIQVIDASPRKVLGDLMRIKKLKVRHAERVTETPFKLDFQMIRVDTVLMLIADVSGLVLHRDGSDAYLFGLNPHAAEIEALREKAHSLSMDGDNAGLKRTLQRIVELSAPAGEGEPGPSVGDELERLARIAMDEGDPAAAERHLRAWLLDIERHEQGGHRQEYALALAELARARLAQDDRREAQTMFERALAVLSTSELGDQLDRARILGDLGVLALESERIEVAVDHADQAWKIVSGTTAEVAQEQSLAILHARIALDSLESRLGEAFMERKDHAAAEVHLERAVVLAEALWGADDRLAFMPRQQLTMNAWLMGRPGRAAKLHQGRIDAAQAAGDTRSFALADALANLAAIRAREGDSKAAAALGVRYLGAVESATGATGARADSARRFLALLYRLDRRFDAADEIEGKAAARSTAMAVPPPADADSILDTFLAMQLASHFDRQLESLKGAAKDESRRAALQENAAEAYSSAGIELLATDRWHEALATLRRLKGLKDAGTLRVAKRLLAIHERNGSAMGLERVRREMLPQ